MCTACKKVVDINKGWVWKDDDTLAYFIYHDRCMPERKIGSLSISPSGPIGETSRVKLKVKDTRPSMDKIWMQLALTLRKRSTCSRLQVGSVITSKDLGRVYSVGYNGGAKGQKHECESQEPGLCGHIHAEINALIKCQVNDPEKILYVSNLPCVVCAKAIVNSGFSKVIYKDDYRIHEAVDILKLAGIKVLNYETDINEN